MDSVNIITYLKKLFLKYDSVSLDFEGDRRYLREDSLADFLDWLHMKFGDKKKFLYTIAIRSKYDILHKFRENYVQKLLNLYESYSNFEFILVAGNKKYVDKKYLNFSLGVIFHKWIQTLLKINDNKAIYIGGDSILKISKEILESYEKTKIVLLKNPDLEDQKRYFGVQNQSRIGIYALYIETTQQAIQSDFIQSYLSRRGIGHELFEEKIGYYSIAKNTIQKENTLEKYNFLFLFSTN